MSTLKYFSHNIAEQWHDPQLKYQIQKNSHVVKLRNDLQKKRRQWTHFKGTWGARPQITKSLKYLDLNTVRGNLDLNQYMKFERSGNKKILHQVRF